MNNCLFCKIISNEISCKKIFEDDHVIAFLDINPISLGHALVVPKKHFVNLLDCENETLKNVIVATKEVAKKLITNVPEIKGFNYLSNQGEISGQVINHFHIHVIPKYSNKGFQTSVQIDKDSFKNQNFIDKIIIK